MPLPTLASFVKTLLDSGLLDATQTDELPSLQTMAADARSLAQELLHRDWLTAYQVNQIFLGKIHELTIGPFILLERLGEGGMGQVFKARQKALNRVVALKVIRKDCLNNPKVVMRFQREIRAAGQLSHPHIVRAYDADQVNGTYYIAMEYIDGDDLAQCVQDNGPLRVDRACEYIRQAALGLQHASERGLVHRDIKPANLLVARAVTVDRRRSSGVVRRPPHLEQRKSSGVLPRMEPTRYPWGVVKILDMGLARCTDVFYGRASTQLTQLGSVMGTPEYIAPEQVRDSHNSDVRADLYSLGCTLYFLLTSQPPFPDGTLTDKLMAHQFNEPGPVEPLRRQRLKNWKGTQGPVLADEATIHVPPCVQEVVHKLLAKRPDDRYQTPNELADALQGILHQFEAGSLQTPETIERTMTSTKLTLEPVPAEAVNEVTMILATEAPKPEPSATNYLAATIAIVLATLGGLSVITFLTLMAIVISGNNPMRAHTKNPEEPKPKVQPDAGKAKR